MSHSKRVYRFICQASLLCMLIMMSKLASANIITELNHDAFKAISDESLVIDVRTPEEYAEGHVPGAVNIPLASIADKVDTLGDKSQAIVVYCRSGYRAGKALEVLVNEGFSNLHHLEGDITAWQAAGQPMDVPKAP